MIVIVDYGMGNLGSVLKSLKRIKTDAKLSTCADDILNADKLILPGVGHFSNGMKKLSDLGYIEVLNEKVLNQKVPILGICLGMQLFAKFSEEGNVEGLSWLDADVVKFDIEDKFKYKVPQMGWNSVKINKRNQLLNNVAENELFYFVHSYHMVCRDLEDILTTTNYSYNFTSSVQKDNIFGTQFHPEKSHDWGLQIIKNFVTI